MTYQVLARKWRPQDFASLVGQDSIKTALQNALEEGRVAQAYLFSGIRGVGKTTTARIFAKALNCENGPGREPCNDCPTCHDITAGSDLDVIEVDAATYSKVEQIRELTESLRYGPARDRFKVVVIDEIHRLSRQAFDALLKIVEEPPRHLTFIFATTESESVPATILSRCQEYRFRRVSAQVLSAYLRQISDAEEIEVGERALRLIARAGEGSVRDSVALLDQLATFGGGAIADDDAVRLLGGLDAALFERLLQSVLGGDAAAVSTVVREIEDNGWDPKSAYSQFLGYCRDALHLSLGADPEQIDLPPDDIVSLGVLARKAGYENLLRMLNQLLSSEQVLRKSETPSLALEIAWLRAAELPKLQQLEELLGAGPRGNSSASNSPASSGSRTSQPGTATARAGAAASRLETSRSERPAEDETPADAEGPATVEPFLELVRKAKPSLRAHLEQARLSYSAGVLAVEAVASDGFLRDALERHRSVLDRAVTSAWGSQAKWRVVLASESRAGASELPGATEDVPAVAQRPARRQAQRPSGVTGAEVPARPSSKAGPSNKAEPAAPTQRAAATRGVKRGSRSPASTQPSPPAARASQSAARDSVARGSVAGNGADASSSDRTTALRLAEASKSPTVQAVLELFGGTIVSVELREQESRAQQQSRAEAEGALAPQPEEPPHLEANPVQENQLEESHLEERVSRS